MINFEDCDVIINGTGILADSASISQENSLDSLKVVGLKDVFMVPVGALINNVQISYKLIPSKDPNFEIVTKLKTFVSGIEPIQLEIGGVSCSGYLTSYSINSSPNETTRATVSYISFFPTQGVIAPKRDTIEYTEDTNKFANGFTSLVNFSNTGFLKTYNIDYSVNFDYIPVYCLGNKYPKEIHLNGGSERASFIKDKYTNLDFYGNTLLQIFQTNQVLGSIYELGYISGVDVPSISFDFSDSKITTIGLNANVNSYLTTEIVAERFF